MSGSAIAVLPDELIVRPDFDTKGTYTEHLAMPGPFYGISDVKRANDRLGHHFFEPATMRFFRSRIAPGLSYGRVFVTSEQFDASSPRLYSVRAARDDGSIVELSAFDSLRAARRFVRSLGR